MKINIFNISLVSLFSLLFVVPFHYYWIKAPFFAIIVLGISLRLFKKRDKRFYRAPKRSFPIIELTYWYVLLGLIFILIGLQKAPENSLFYVGALYVIYPIVWGFIAYGLERKHIILIYNTLIISTIFISLYTISYFLFKVGLSNFRLIKYIAMLDIARNADVNAGVAAVNLVSISTLIFASSFLLSLVSLKQIPNGLVWKKSRIIYWGIVFLALLAIIISGRRGAAITVLITLPISYVLSLFLPDEDRHHLKIRALIVTIVLFVGVLFLFFVILGRLQINTFNYIRYIWNSITELDPVRGPEKDALIEGWSRSLFWGVGHGVPADVIRNSIKPWRYEMSYYSLLFHTGILGFWGYSIGFIFIFIKGIQLIKKGGDDANLMVAQLTGLAAMLIAYATNPYFDALDILWVIFLPVAYINTSLNVSD